MATLSSVSPAAKPMVTRSAALPVCTERMDPSMTISFSFGRVPPEAIAAGMPMALISWTSWPAISAPSLRPWAI